MALTFHGVLADEAEAARDELKPFQIVTVAHIRQCVEHFQAHGYRFVAPEDVIRGLDAAGRFAMLTFDDGYANNERILPVLKELDVPATVFVTTSYVESGNAYWWDVVYRERRRRGVPSEMVWREINELKARRHDDIEAYLRRELCAEALRPMSDLHRPMTRAELEAFAAKGHVRLGSHTADHAILTNYDRADVVAQIETAQAYIRDLMGTAPIAIAYHNGDHSPEVVPAARDAGLKVGFTVAPRKTRLPVEPGVMMTLGRFAIDGTPSLFAQCVMCRSERQRLRRLVPW